MHACVAKLLSLKDVDWEDYEKGQFVRVQVPTSAHGEVVLILVSLQCIGGRCSNLAMAGSGMLGCSVLTPEPHAGGAPHILPHIGQTHCHTGWTTRLVTTIIRQTGRVWFSHWR